MSGQANLVGEILGETYKLERLLGEGGMGVVYEASHLRLRRRFAIKVLYPEVAANAEAMARFQQEALITSELGHKNIVEVIDFNHTDAGVPYIVMELLEGEDLEALLEREQRLDPSLTAEILRQVASALQSAHGHGIVHRDLKPSNIFLCQRSAEDTDPHDSAVWIKVVDFGISKVLGASSSLTKTRFTMGTPGYMSPEQAEGRSKEVDARTDIFSLGAILYEMLSGRPPFEGESIPTVLYKVVHQEPAPLRDFPDLPSGLEPVLARAMAKAQADRFEDMTSFAQAFEQALARAQAAQPGAPAPQAGPSTGLDPTMFAKPVDLTPTSAAAKLLPTVAAPVQGGGAAASARRLWQQARSTVVQLVDRALQSCAGAAVARRTSDVLARLGVPPARRWIVGVGLLVGLSFGGSVAAVVGSFSADPEELERAELRQDLEDLAATPIAAAVTNVDDLPLADEDEAEPRRRRRPSTYLIQIRSTDTWIACNLELDNGESQAASIPCRFEVPSGSRVKLQLTREGYRALNHAWTIDRDHSMSVKKIQAKHELRLADLVGVDMGVE
jgi:serine/threonine protein kinase